MKYSKKINKRNLNKRKKITIKKITIKKITIKKNKNQKTFKKKQFKGGLLSFFSRTDKNIKKCNDYFEQQNIKNFLILLQENLKKQNEQNINRENQIMHLINEIRSINKPPYNECFYRKDRKKIEYFFDYLNKLYQSNIINKQTLKATQIIFNFSFRPYDIIQMFKQDKDIQLKNIKLKFVSNTSSLSSRPSLSTSSLSTPSLSTPSLSTPSLSLETETWRERPSQSENLIKGEITLNNENIMKEQAKNIISNAIYKNKNKITKNFLNNVCSNSGFCLTFGKEVNKINKFFDYFQNFNYIDNDILPKPIGIKSANGFIIKINYNRDNYKVSSILKSSNSESDNLYYEYVVGLFINKLNKYHSCFLQTYGIFEYKTLFNKMNLMNNIRYFNEKKIKSLPINFNIFNNISRKTPDELLKISCKNQDLVCILIQNIDATKTLKDIYLKDFKNNCYFFFCEILYVLFQIYIPLYYLRNVYTHYDLHANNVLLFELNNEYVEFIYHLDDGSEIRFKTSYIAKIIDYGRCYFNDVENNMNSKLFFENICKEEMCTDQRQPNIHSTNEEEQKNLKCGIDKGYDNLIFSEHYQNQWTTYQKNISQDLRLLKIISYDIPSNIDYNINNKQYNFDEFEKNNIYELLIFFYNINFINRYYTVENNQLNGKINNLSDVFYFLSKQVVKTSQIKLNNKMYSKKNKIGELHIYYDINKEIEFIPNTNNN